MYKTKDRRDPEFRRQEAWHAHTSQLRRIHPLNDYDIPKRRYSAPGMTTVRNPNDPHTLVPVADVYGVGRFLDVRNEVAWLAEQSDAVIESYLKAKFGVGKVPDYILNPQKPGLLPEDFAWMWADPLECAWIARFRNRHRNDVPYPRYRLNKFQSDDRNRPQLHGEWKMPRQEGMPRTVMRPSDYNLGSDDEFLQDYRNLGGSKNPSFEQVVRKNQSHKFELVRALAFDTSGKIPLVQRCKWTFRLIFRKTKPYLMLELSEIIPQLEAERRTKYTISRVEPCAKKKDTSSTDKTLASTSSSTQLGGELVSGDSVGAGGGSGAGSAASEGEMMLGGGDIGFSPVGSVAPPASHESRPLNRYRLVRENGSYRLILFGEEAGGGSSGEQAGGSGSNLGTSRETVVPEIASPLNSTQGSSSSSYLSPFLSNPTAAVRKVSDSIKDDTGIRKWPGLRLTAVNGRQSYKMRTAEAIRPFIKYLYRAPTLCDYASDTTFHNAVWIKTRSEVERIVLDSRDHENEEDPGFITSSVTGSSYQKAYSPGDNNQRNRYNYDMRLGLPNELVKIHRSFIDICMKEYQKGISEEVLQFLDELSRAFEEKKDEILKEVLEEIALEDAQAMAIKDKKRGKHARSFGRRRRVFDDDYVSVGSLLEDSDVEGVDELLNNELFLLSLFNNYEEFNPILDEKGDTMTLDERAVPLLMTLDETDHRSFGFGSNLCFYLDADPDSSRPLHWNENIEDLWNEIRSPSYLEFHDLDKNAPAELHLFLVERTPDAEKSSASRDLYQEFRTEEEEVVEQVKAVMVGGGGLREDPNILDDSVQSLIKGKV